MGAGFKLTLAGCIVYTLLNVIPMWDMWRRRREVLVRARFPYYTLVTNFTFFFVGEIIFLQEVLRQKSVHMPESIMLWTSCLAPPFLIVPYVLRGARVLVLTSEFYRKALLEYITLKNQVAFLGSFLCSSICLGAVLEINRGQGILAHLAYNYIFEPALINIFIALLAAVPVVKCCLLLFAANDSLRVGMEMCRTVASLFLISIPYFVIVVLHDLGLINSLDSRVQFMIVLSAMHLNFESLIVSRRMWAKGRPRSDRVHVGSKEITSDGGIVSGVNSISLMSCPTLGSLYGKFVEKNLCFESFSFLSDTLKYKAAAIEGVYDIDKQFEDFSAIVKLYLTKNSVLEINVGTALSCKVLAKSKERVFKALSKVERETIFDECAKEVGILLDQNLLLNFMNSLEYKIAVASRTAARPRLKMLLQSAMSIDDDSYDENALVILESELKSVHDLL